MKGTRADARSPSNALFRMDMLDGRIVATARILVNAVQ